MDPEVLKDLYERATSQGYSKSIEEFTQLISSDQEVLDDNFDYVKTKGYSKDISEFSKLVGFGEKKKRCRYSFRWGRGSYGIHYRSGNTAWVFGWFRSKR